MNTPEDLLKKTRIVEDIIEKERQRQERIKNLMSNTEYIDWLIEFTNDKEGFSDDEWIYSSEKLDDATEEKVNDLQLFFEGIYEYTKRNYIYSLTRPYGECYKIKLGEIGFEIGYASGQGTYFYCRRTPLEEMENAIDFMDIINNKKQDNVEYIESSLEQLSSMFIELYNNGVPIEAMINTINSSMKYIHKKEQEKGDTEEQMILKKGISSPSTKN